jgi:hypothetical protein
VKSLPNYAGAALLRQLGHGVLPSHAGDGIAGMTLAWCDVTTMSC